MVVLMSPTVATAQTLELFGSAGPTITDRGNSVAAGAGFSPVSWIALVFNVERTHLSTQNSFADGVFSSFRGGTLFLATGEVRFVPLGRHRLGPYGLAGAAAGVSRPNVTAIFPDRVTHYVQAIVMGGGVQVPVGERMMIFTELRMTFGAEGREGIVAVAPARVGLSWRF